MRSLNCNQGFVGVSSDEIYWCRNFKSAGMLLNIYSLHQEEGSVVLLMVCLYLRIKVHFLAHLSRRLEWAIVIAHRPSSVRPSSVRKLFTFSTSSPKPLDGFWRNLVGMKHSWSLTSVVVFRPDPSRADPGWGQNRSRGVPFFKKFLLQTGRLQRQTNA